MTANPFVRRSFVVLALGAALSACSEEIVYRDLPDFDDPPAGALGFLGYTDVDAGRTACGNCHSGKQVKWRQTAHASAWSALSSSSAAAPRCEGCHSVGFRGNATTDSLSGYAATKNARYQDVQCESCHGPGLQHVSNPDLPENKPLASIAVGPGVTNGCGECHSGSHQPFVEEWAASRHARVDASRAGNPSCNYCHEPRAVLEAWGVKSNYTEVGPARPPYLAITCVTCHDPHDATNPKQLRFRIDVPDEELNLCMKCHHKRAEPDVNSSRGPHSPQGPLLLGEAGWIPPNFTYPPGSLVGTHGSDANPKLCATCHVNAYSITKSDGTGTFNATGHSFQPIPCVDSQGIPTGSTTCADTERSFKSCVGCHLSESGARSARALAKTRLDRLSAELDTLLARVPASQFSTTDNKITTAEGAKFNSGLAKERGSPVHNPFLVEALLIASIQQVKTEYGVSLPPGFALSSPMPQLKPPPSLGRK